MCAAVGGGMCGKVGGKVDGEAPGVRSRRWNRASKLEFMALIFKATSSVVVRTAVMSDLRVLTSDRSSLKEGSSASNLEKASGVREDNAASGLGPDTVDFYASSMALCVCLVGWW